MAKYYTTTEELTSIANAIRAKTNDNSSLVYPNGFVSAIESISSQTPVAVVEEKDVNFIDYDGTLLYSYTAQEAQALTALPANPSHSGLTAEGWNWTLAEIKTQLTNVGGKVWVGQEYNVTDGKTEIEIVLDDPNHLSPYLSIAVNGTVVIDWGDGSSTTTVTGGSNTGLKNNQHTYASTGRYVIKISVTSGKFTFYSDSTTYANVIRYGVSSSDLRNLAYSDAIRSIKMGANCYLGDRCLSNCQAMTSFLISHDTTSTGYSVFYYNYNLKCLVFPRGITTLQGYITYDAKNMEHISFPPTITTIGSYFCINQFNLKSITIPYSVTTINERMFQNCSQLREVRFPDGISTLSYMLVSCKDVQQVKLPTNLTTLGARCFYECYSIQSLTIPASVTTISTEVFYDCYGMYEYHFLSETPPTLSNINAFTHIPTGCIIYVPYSSDHSILEAYQTAQNWSTYASYMQEEPQS